MLSEIILLKHYDDLLLQCNSIFDVLIINLLVKSQVDRRINITVPYKSVESLQLAIELVLNQQFLSVTRYLHCIYLGSLQWLFYS